MKQKERGCPTEFLSDFLSDSLPPRQSESIELHLESCEGCRARLKDESGGGGFWSLVANISDDQFDHDWSSFTETPKVEDSSVGESADSVSYREASMRAIFETIKPMLSPSDDPKSAGKIGNYEVLGMIGSGGMGVVLKAKDVSLDRVVAIKLLAPHLAAFEISRKRFRREAKAAAAVKHNGIISIHGVDSHQGVPYFVMPYEAGPSLQLRIHQEGKLTVEETLNVALQIAGALKAAHQTGLVHRDIKPSNILLAPGTERALLTDFGLAQVCDQQNITQTGMVAGTPMFMSPEQARGENVDSRSDLFSLGSVIFMMLAGRPPIKGDSSYAIVRQIGGQEMPRLRTFEPSQPEWLERLVSRLHELEPKRRLQSADELEELLSKALAHVRNPNEHRLPESLSPKQVFGRSNWRSSLAILSSVAVAICLILVFTYPWSPTVEQLSPKPLVSPVARSKLSSDKLESNSASLENSEVCAWDDQLDAVVRDMRQQIEIIESDLDKLLDEK